MRKTILFIDDVCPKPYDDQTLATEALGGTEATVVRIASKLYSELPDSWVIIEQHNRELKRDEDNAVWAPKGYTKQADYVICLRDPKTAYEARLRFPKAKVYLWCHDLSGDALGIANDLLKATKTDLICVSDFHRSQTTDRLQSYGYKGEYRVHRIYNPIDDDLKPEEPLDYDKNKLIWFSSPHKGLDYALQIFNNLLSFNPDFTLFVANPGYLPSPDTLPNKVVSLGALPHHEAIKHVRNSLCVFYPNIVFPETFGLVIAEANAVGTPVLTHDFGAASEVSDHPSEVLDCRDVKNVIDRAMAWHSGNRPYVVGPSKFKLTNVIQEWIRKILV